MLFRGDETRKMWCIPVTLSPQEPPKIFGIYDVLPQTCYHTLIIGQRSRRDGRSSERVALRACIVEIGAL